MTSAAKARMDSKAFIAMIDKLLDQRRAEVQNGTRPYSDFKCEDKLVKKRFSGSQLNKCIWSTYQSMKSGKIVTPPERDKVMKIADYLECTLEERNRLLKLAEYYPMYPYLEGDELKEALAVAQETLDFMPLPSYIITRDWDIQAANTHLLKLIGMTRKEFDAIPSHLKNIIQIIFDPKLPIYEMLYVNKENWEYIAQRNIYGFKIENMFCEYEDWYQQRVKRWKDLPSLKEPLFEQYWKEIEVDSQIDFEKQKAPFPFYETKMRLHTGQLVRFRTLLITFGNYNYPQVVSYLPMDQESLTAFIQLGVPIPTEWKPKW